MSSRSRVARAFPRRCGPSSSAQVLVAVEPHGCERAPGRGKLPAVTENHLTLGAHLLLWGFPLAITVLVLVTAIRGRDQSVGTP